MWFANDACIMIKKAGTLVMEDAGLVDIMCGVAVYLPRNTFLPFWM